MDYTIATAKQARFLIDQEMKKSSAKSSVLAEESDLSNVHKVSSLVITKNEETGEFGTQIEFLEQPKDMRSGEYMVTSKGNPIYRKCIVTGEQLDAYCDTPEAKGRMYDMLSQYHQSGDVVVRFGTDNTPWRYAQYSGLAFSPQTKPKNIDGFTPTSYTEKCATSFSDVYDENRRKYYEEHKPVRIAYTLEKAKLPNPVRVEAGVDVEAVKQFTGIEPVEVDGKLYYETGYKFVPMVACDKQNPNVLYHQPDKAVPNPYLVNYKAKLEADAPTKTYHDLLIDPSYATTLAEHSQITMSADKKSAVGVTNTTVYYHDHSYTKDFTDESNKYIMMRNLRNQFTNEALSEENRPAVPPNHIFDKPPRGTVRTANISQSPLPPGIYEQPGEPFDIKAHEVFVARSVKVAMSQKGKSSKSSNLEKWMESEQNGGSEMEDMPFS